MGQKFQLTFFAPPSNFSFSPFQPLINILPLVNFCQIYRILHFWEKIDCEPNSDKESCCQNLLQNYEQNRQWPFTFRLLKKIALDL